MLASPSGRTRVDLQRARADRGEHPRLAVRRSQRRAPARRLRGSRRRPCARSPCRPGERLSAPPDPGCAASTCRPSTRRRTPARARRTVSPARCDRSDTMMSLRQRRAFLGRELVGDRPSRRPRREAEQLALDEVVDLHDAAVDVVFEIVAVLLPVGAVLGHLDRWLSSCVMWGLTGNPSACEEVRASRGAT